MEINSLGPFMGLLCASCAVTCFLFIGFMVTLQRALSRCAPQNRFMEPQMVWLNVIPLWGFFWSFRTVSRLAESLQKEFVDRGLDDGSDYGFTLGIATATISVLDSFAGMLARTTESGAGLFGLLFTLVGGILFVLYWIRIAGYSKRLADDDLVRRDDDEPEDRRRRPRRRQTSTGIKSTEKDDRYT
jgi:hypothetical protein